MESVDSEGAEPHAAVSLDATLFDSNNPKVRQLLEAAGRLFMELPYDSVSTDAIAREAKVSKATLYVYFPSKEALFANLIRSRCHQLAGDVWTSPFALDDIEQELRRFARTFMQVLEAPDTMPLYRSVISQSARFAELGRIFYETGPKGFETRLTDLLTEAGKRGMLDIPDPRRGAVQFMQLVAGDLPIRGLLGLELDDPETSKANVDAAVALFLAGYRPNA